MTGARGDALEWALALAQAPGERHALRERPLPEGIETLLQIAAGSHGGALQAAMARSGETEAELVEAVRFYLREVLFHSGADAYRVLGLAHGASGEQIKGHHRLLQQWLHPDRHTSDWDAIFAGRVNAAWNALRTPERRAAYDASHPTPLASAPATTRWLAPHVVVADPMEVETASTRWRRRAPVLALFAACGLLGIAAVRDALREPDSGYRSVAEEASPTPAPDPIALRLPTSTSTSTSKLANGSGKLPPRRAGAPLAGRSVAARMPSPASVRSIAPTRPLPGEVALAPPVPPSEAPRAATAIRQEPVPPAEPSPAVVAAVIAPPPVVRAPSAESAASLPSRVATTSPEPAPLPAATVAVATLAMASPQRIRQAQRTGKELLAFLEGPGTVMPPIWDSLAAQQRAQRLRERLHASGDIRAGDPQWRVDREDAALQATFGDSAQVRAQLIWREQRWLVSGVALEQAP